MEVEVIIWVYIPVKEKGMRIEKINLHDSFL